MTPLSVLEICAGAGGQSLGLEQAGFWHAAAVEIEAAACQTLRLNRPYWKVIQDDVRNIDGRAYHGIDLLAGGVPCPPFSMAGKQLGAEDDRDLFPEALRLISEAQPAAVMIENVRGFASPRFDAYRNWVLSQLRAMGYVTAWQVLNASSYGVPQLRPRFVLVALRSPYADAFQWPEPAGSVQTVGEVIGDLMAARNWPGSEQWAVRAKGIAPTIVGGSKKHGGPDLGPTRARQQWRLLGVDGLGYADEPPGPECPPHHLPRLTARMVARLQGFPDIWQFAGRKTAVFRQIGNAFPPPVACAVGEMVHQALTGAYGVPRQPSLFRLVG